MKSNMTQLIMVTLAILFAMALSLTVALICLSYAGGSMERPSEDSTTAGKILSPSDTTLRPSDTTRLPVPEETTAILTPEPPPIEELGNGLSFASNGDGTCTLTGIGKCDDACIVIPETSPAGDLVTSIAPRALYGCAFATAVQLPATVTSIGSLAFAACPSLVYISVDDANPYFCDIDGILYTSDGRALLVYPSMRAGSEITISALTTEICEMAFYDCPYLKHIYYTGSPEEWESISVGAKNYSLTAASKSFHAGKGS